jgi:hypothetical protein
MKAAEIISMLEDLNPNTEVYFCPKNSTYVEDFSIKVKSDVEVRTFFGRDHEAAIIFSGHQVGQI